MKKLEKEKKTWNSWKKKKKKKLDEEKIEKTELWGKLNELNKEFLTINITKRNEKNV